MDKRQKTVNRSEEVEQAKVVRWSHRPAVRLLMPELRWLHHSPNGGRRDAFTGAQMKALGVKPGFPDLILPVRMGDSSGLIIEMKAENGRTSDAQKEWIEHFKDQGWETAIARSANEAREMLCNYLDIHPDSVQTLED